MKKIKSALISVYHKDGLDDLIKLLAANGVQLYSTGGTFDFIQSLGFQAIAVEQLTTYPSILGGRVKTLHPSVFGGILARRDDAQDISQMQQYNIPEIDMVIVDLYPFEQTVASGAHHEDIIEKIDIGGISLIRAAAKNHKDVLIVPAKRYYQEIYEYLNVQQCASDLDMRKRFAAYAFQVSSHYDTAIFNYFNADNIIPAIRVGFDTAYPLRYGENPHQTASFYGDLETYFEQLNGKEISYNNLLDIDAAIHLIDDFDDLTFAIIKHNNACGLASRPTVLEAWKAALAGDPVSAFGGVLVTNHNIDAATATEIDKLFCEVLIAPSYDDEALATLKSKKNRIILKRKSTEKADYTVRTAINGVLWQSADSYVENPKDLKTVTITAPNAQQVEDLLFANKLVKHTKSNAIVFAKDKQLVASGTGQTSRIDALQQAVVKANHFGFDLHGAVMASDAFFPFADCVEEAYKVGVTAVIQPGGSIKDQDSIDYCNQHQMAMVTTGYRHFKH
ncbi:bifunctional purine biosynthesis protein PurH [Bacteroidia bacterium]|nr:bifunctional purine biosynthesis protein PurH [Bacteroidia bacterium]